MNIKEIALKAGLANFDNYQDDGKTLMVAEFDVTDQVIRTVESAVAELAKQNEPVYAFRRKGLDNFCTCDENRFNELSQKPNLFEVRVFYALPPTASQIEQETAEAIAAYLTSGRYMALNPGVLISTEQHTQYIKNHDIYQANAIQRGAWKEFKK